jgi:cob(I)alamin adenosyltransferase
VKIYTRRGDRGETDLFGGGRVSKDNLRVCAYGDVDELNACLGVAVADSEQSDLCSTVLRIQCSLFDLGSQLATPKRDHDKIPRVQNADVAELELEIDRLESELESLESFILPGGTRTAAAFHHARTVCRRAERNVVALDREEELDEPIVQYLNRLSDLLFVMARVENRRAKVSDIAWVGRER